MRVPIFSARMFWLLAGGLVATAIASLPHAQGQTSGSRMEQFALLAGDSIAVRFPEPFCVSRLIDGEPIRAEVAEDKMSDRFILVAQGTPVDVKIVAAEGNGRPGKPGKMELTFTSVTAADGAKVPLVMPASIKREGHGRNIISKILTLFLIKGTQPCVFEGELFHPKIQRNTAVFLERP